METQKITCSQRILNRKSNAGSRTISALKLHYKAVEIKRLDAGTKTCIQTNAAQERTQKQKPGSDGT